MRFILFFLLLFITTHVLSQKNSACECIEYHGNKVKSTTPLLEFQEAYKGNQLHEVSNGLFWDTLLINKHLEQTDYLHLSDFFFLNLTNDHYYQDSPHIGFAKENDTVLVNTLYSHFLQENSEFNENEVRLLWSAKSEDVFGDEEQYHTLFIVKKVLDSNFKLSSENIKSVEIETNYYSNSEYTSLKFDKLGTEAWYNFTSENLGNFVSIISYNKVLSSPMINGAISGGQAIITFGNDNTKNETMYNLFNCHVYSRKIGQKKFEEKLEKCK